MNNKYPGFRVVFKSYICAVQFHRYRDFGNNVCIKLTAVEDPNQDPEVFPGEPIATATINIEGIPEDHVAVKDYSENQGMLASLIKANIVHSPVTYRQQGFVRVPICALTDKALEAISQIESE